MSEIGGGQERPKKASRGLTAVVVVALVFAVFVISVTVRSCSVTKRIDSGKKEQQNVETQTETETEKNNGEDLEKNQNNSHENGVSTPSGGENEKENNSGMEEPKNNGKVETPDGISVERVFEPSLSVVMEGSGLVIERNIYLWNNSYIYSLRVSVSNGDSAITAEYFCPKKTFDAVQSGDTLKVSYQVDSNGNVSISSISK